MTTTSDFRDAADKIVAAGRFLAAKGWAPATAGNYSIRLADGNIAITVSGKEKGELKPDDIMLVDREGNVLDGRKPSAETLLHIGIYRAQPDCNAVLHTHSRESTVFTKRFPGLETLALRDYEFLKLYPGVVSHDTLVEVPIFNNTQDISALQAVIDPHLKSDVPAYIIRSHGIYGWGPDIDAARRIVEATEFMLACELELRS